MKKSLLAIALIGASVTAYMNQDKFNTVTEVKSESTIPSAASAVKDALETTIRPSESNEQANASVINAAVSAIHRTESYVTRDQYRNPAETLKFFGVKNTDTVVEILPGGGYYTEILAPLVKDNGQYIAAHYPIVEGDESYRSKSRVKFNDKLANSPEVYGETFQIVDFISQTELAPETEGSADFVLTFRSLHGLVNSDKLAAAFAEFNRLLKKGGKLGIVQHRADDGIMVETAKKGYIPTPHVLAVAALNGFALVKESEVNANALDTKDYEKGVWTLPPSLANGETDKEKYVAIGESDRMTLLFVKK